MYRFTVSVFPSEDDDVITSPYNALLSLAQLCRHADCVLPVENQALADIVGRLDNKMKAMPANAVAGTAPTGKSEAALHALAINPVVCVAVCC